MKVTVRNKRSKDILVYVGPSPKEAVMAAYAQEEKHDFCTWEYKNNYEKLAVRTTTGWRCGKWEAKDSETQE